ncbi:hypothetical protein [Thermococcus sp.]
MEFLDYLFELMVKLPPRVALDGYWRILQIIDFGLTDCQEVYNVNLSREWLSLDELPENAWKVIIDDILTLLVEANLVKISSCGGYKKTEDLEEIYKLLEVCIRHANSTRRLIAWALLRFLKSGNREIEVEDIIREISYPDEVYESLLGDQVFGSNVLRAKPFLLSNPAERIEYVIQKHEKNGDSVDIIEKIREIEKGEILKVFSVLGLNENELLQTKSLVKKELEECYGAIWPSFGKIPVRDKYYFKLLRRQSSTLYVDLPNSIMEVVVDQLAEFSDNAPSISIFENQANVFLKTVNEGLAKQGISWLAFSLRTNKFMKKPYGLKISIKWPEFIKFIDRFSASDRQIWEKYEYISACRLPTLKMRSRNIAKSGKDQKDYFERIQKKVKSICRSDLEGINAQLKEIKNLLVQLQKKSWRFMGKIDIPLSVAFYIPEAIALIDSINEMAKKGLFPSAYREIRNFLENLSWALFGDYLALECYRRHKDTNICADNYALTVSKGWYEWARKNKGTINLRAARGEINKEIHESLKSRWNLPGKDKFWSILLSTLTYPSFVLLFGKKIENENFPQEIPRYLTSTQITPHAIRDFELLGRELGVSHPREFGVDLAEKAITDKSASILPSYPTNDFVIATVEKWFNIKGLNRKYEEYSAFVHSYPQSWVVFPFSSVIEVKAFKKELGDIRSIIEMASRQYIDLLKTK